MTLQQKASKRDSAWLLHGYFMVGAWLMHG